MGKTFFLDRDGVINAGLGYVHQQSNFECIDGIFDLIRMVYALNYKLIVIANQAGVGREYSSESQFNKISVWMYDKFKSQNAPVAEVYFPPCHPTEGIGEYKKDHFSKRPYPRMILKVREKLNINLKSPILIGDKVSEIRVEVSGCVGCNTLFSRKFFPELSGITYQQIASLRDAIPILRGLNFGEQKS